MGRALTLAWKASLCAAVLGLGCQSEPEAEEKDNKGSVGIASLTSDSFPVSDAQVIVGVTGLWAEPDSAGIARFDKVKKGETVMRIRQEGFTTAALGLEVFPGEASAGRMYLSPTDLIELEDAATGVLIEEPGVFAVDFAEGEFLVRHEPGTGPIALEYGWVTPEHARALPGSLTEYIAQDDSFGTVEILAAIEIKRPEWEDGTDVSIADSVPLTVWGLPDDRDLRIYSFDEVEGYWRRGALVQPTDDGGLTGNIGWGWWAVGEPVDDWGCVTGVVSDLTGGGLAGADVIIDVPSILGQSRTTADQGGAFCAAVPTGVEEAILTAWGWSREMNLLYTVDSPIDAAAGAASCDEPSSCTQLSGLTPVVHRDEDNDGYFDGAGDCDDNDPGVNPTLHFGDGTVCYSLPAR